MTHHPEAVKAVRHIVASAGMRNLTPDQMQQQGENHHFNSPGLRKAFRTHKESGLAVRRAYEDKAHEQSSTKAMAERIGARLERIT